LPRERHGAARKGLFGAASLGRLRRGEITGVRADVPPYATLAIVAVSCGVWIATAGAYLSILKYTIFGPLQGEWWRLFSSQFVYFHGFYSGLYMFATLSTVAIFGWLLERRHGPLVVLALFFGAGVTGALVADAVYVFPIVSGANAGALALLTAWVAPNLLAARTGDYYEADLLGTAAIALVLLALPFARPEASWIAGVVGGVLGLTVGLGLTRARSV
jgi:hypothetical protein